MGLLNRLLPQKSGLLLQFFFRPAPKPEVQRWENFPSKHLKRKVRLEVVLPFDYYQAAPRSYPVLFLNDGQDLAALKYLEVVGKLFKKEQVTPFITVAIHAGDRMQEYGTAGQADYKKRGAKASAYTDFLLQELMPELERRYRLSPHREDRAIAGFSLGGLSAFDIAWNHHNQFGKVGVFSGSLWWRSTPFDEKAPDAGRIPQAMAEKGPKREGLQFWFQAGTKDEESDRNKNGIIDAIDDTLQLIEALKELGYEQKRDIEYVEVKNGRHNPKTWGEVMPEFLAWAFSNSEARRM